MVLPVLVTDIALRTGRAAEVYMINIPYGNASSACICTFSPLHGRRAVPAPKSSGKCGVIGIA